MRVMCHTVFFNLVSFLNAGLKLHFFFISICSTTNGTNLIVICNLLCRRRLPYLILYSKNSLAKNELLAKDELAKNPLYSVIEKEHVLDVSHTCKCIF